MGKQTQAHSRQGKLDKAAPGTVALNLAGMQLTNLAFLTEYKNIVRRG